jgi:hypothetical protein
MSNENLLEVAKPILTLLGGLDLSEPEKARRQLEEAFPPDGGVVLELRRLFREGVEEGWLCGQAGGAARFSRVAKASEETQGFSVDAVRLSGPGVWHQHVKGEVNLCFSEEGARFDGRPQGWIVFAPQSEHVPTASGGTMDILYFIPGGALKWKKEG